MRIIRIVEFLGFLFLFCGCSQEYIPTQVNTPLLSNSGQLQVNGGGGVSGLDIQFAYALPENIGVMLNGSFSDRSGTTLDEEHSHEYIEGAAGYYYPLDETYRVEAYGGYGTGNIGEFYTTYDSTKGEASLQKFFVQPNIGIFSTHYDLGFGLRVGMQNLEHEHPDAPTGSYNLMLEPAFTAKAGIKPLKLYMQLGYSFLLSNASPAYGRQRLMFSAGVQLDLWNLYYELH